MTFKLKSITTMNGNEEPINRTISSITYYDAQTYGKMALKRIDTIIRDECVIRGKWLTRKGEERKEFHTIDTIRGFTLSCDKCSDVYVELIEDDNTYFQIENW